MSYPIDAWIYQLVITLSCMLELVVAILLYREKGAGRWLMLGGGGAAVISYVAAWTLTLFSAYLALDTLLSVEFQMVLNKLIKGISIFGTLTFCIGLLLYTLHRRGQGNRVAELEAILETIHNQEAGHR